MSCESSQFVLSGNNIFEIGTPTAYMPVSVTLSGIGGPGGTLTSSMTAATHPNLGTSGINTSKYINRYWTLTAGGGLTVSVTTPRLRSQTPRSRRRPNTGALVVRKFNGSTWSAPSSSSSTATTATGTGFTSFSDFAVGELDTTAPTVSDVTSPVPNGPYATGAVIPIQVVFSEVVNVTGTPHLTLATGSPSATPVNYASGSGTTTLTFNYTVAAGNTSSDLDYSATNSLALNGGTIKDPAGNNATLTLASPGATHSLGANKDIVIDATNPSTSVTSPQSIAYNASNVPATFPEIRPTTRVDLD